MDPETRVFQAADGEDLVIHPCDRQMDGQTDRIAMAKVRYSSTSFVCNKGANYVEFNNRMVDHTRLYFPSLQSPCLIHDSLVDSWPVQWRATKFR